MKTLFCIVCTFLMEALSLPAQEVIWDLRVGNKFLYTTFQYWNNTWLDLYTMKEVIGERSFNGKKYAVMRFIPITINGVTPPMDQDSITFLRADGLRLYRWYDRVNIEGVVCSDSLTQNLQNQGVINIGVSTSQIFGIPSVSVGLSYVLGCGGYYEGYSTPFGLTEISRSCSQLRLEKRVSLKAALIGGRVYGDRTTYQRLLPSSVTNKVPLSIVPNPFTSELSILWEQDTEADIGILDVLGRTVRQFHVRPYTQFQWDGKDSNGLPVSIGLYWVRIKTATTTSVVKILKTP